MGSARRRAGRRGRGHDSGNHSRELYGFLGVLTLLGCRRVSSAMWPIFDDAATKFARFWIEALTAYAFDRDPDDKHAFAKAFKQALDGFRDDLKNSPDPELFDHEVFWASYTLYGLG